MSKRCTHNGDASTQDVSKLQIFWDLTPWGLVNYLTTFRTKVGPSFFPRCFTLKTNAILLLNVGNYLPKFNILLTVHHAMILGSCPTWRTNFFQCIYLFIVLYMFRACHAHHQEERILSIHLLVNVTPCWRLYRVLVGSLFPTSTWHSYQHRVTITRSCIDTICFSWWWAWHARNM